VRFEYEKNSRVVFDWLFILDGSLCICGISKKFSCDCLFFASIGEVEPVLQGYFIYVAGGKEIKKEIDKNGWGWNFSGEYVKEVKVAKISGGGDFKLFIIENDVTIFDSGKITVSEPVIYNKGMPVALSPDAGAVHFEAKSPVVSTDASLAVGNNSGK
jgi:hypothetical protein